MPEKTKQVGKLMKKYYENHKPEILWGMKVLQDEATIRQIRQALVKTGYETHKKTVLYEKALDYASK